MFPELTALKQPIAIRTEYIVDKNITFRVQQHGKDLSSEQFTVFNTNEDAAADDIPTAKGASVEKPQPQTLMHVDGKYVSIEEKRAFRDAALRCLPPCNRHHIVRWAARCQWHSNSGMKPRFSVIKDDLGVHIKNAAANGEEVTLQTLGQDI